MTQDTRRELTDEQIDELGFTASIHLAAPVDREVMRQALEAIDAFTDPEGRMPEDTGEFRDLARAGESLRDALAVAPTPPAEQPAEPDQQLCRFYQVQTFPELVCAMERHIERLQAKLPRGEQPAFTRAREG